MRARPEEMDRAIDLLSQLVDTLGKSRRKVDQRLGTGRSRTSQILSGRLDLKFQHILDILDALGIETRAFFEILYSEEKRDPFPGPLAVIYQQKLRELGATLPTASAPPEPPALPPLVTEEDVKRLIDARLAEAFSVLASKKS